jgi:hypothetical protein
VADEPVESFKMYPDRFDPWLLEATVAEFQEFVDRLHALSDELLNECKSRIDARLAAEPQTRVFSLGDRRIIREHWWNHISDRLEAELKFRRSVSKGATKTIGKASVPGAKLDHVAASRRVLVQNNPDLSARELCGLLDREKIDVPAKWKIAGAISVGAFKYTSLRECAQRFYGVRRRSTSPTPGSA